MFKKFTLAAVAGFSLVLFACVSPTRTVFFNARLAAEPGSVIEVGQTARLTVVGQNFPEGLRYQWLIDAGGGTCDPQNSADGVTTYQAPTGIGELSEKPVKVTVEFYIDGAKQDEEAITLTIKAPKPLASPSSDSSEASLPPATSPTVEITKSGVFDPRGERLADDTIEGRVSGVDPAKHKILLFTLAGGQWFIQPYTLGSGRFTAIEKNGRFSNTYHVGVKYAALLCKAEWNDPPTQTLVLPLTDENVVAFSTADGIRAPR